MSLPDFSQVKFNLASVTQHFESQGVELTSENKAQLNTIFEQCDVYDEANNQEGSDGYLSGNEVANFMTFVANALPAIKEHFDNFIDGFKIDKTDKTDFVVSDTDAIFEEISETIDKSPSVNKPKKFSTKSDLRTNYDWSEKEFNEVLEKMLNKPAYKGKFKNSVLHGKAKTFIEAGKKYNIDPRALLAIAMHESGRGISNIALKHNNVGGVGGPGHWKHFDSVDDCIYYMAEILDKRYNEDGYTTLSKLGYSGKYCGKNEASKWIKDNGTYIDTFDSYYRQSELMG